MNNQNRYSVFIIGKTGNAKKDYSTDSHSSLYMVVQDHKQNGKIGYIFDTMLRKVVETF